MQMDVLGTVLVSAGVAGVFLLLKAAHRSRVAETASRFDPEVLEARWRRFARVESAVGLLVLFGAGGGGTWLLSRWLHDGMESMHAARPGFVHHLSFGWSYWALVAAPAVILVLLLLSVTAYKLILGERFEEYRAFGVLRYGFDGLRIAAGLYVLLLMAATAGFVLGADTYAGATKTEFVVDRYFSFEEHRYDLRRIKAVREIVEMTSGRPKRSYAVELDDGTVWKSEQVTFEDPSPPPALIAYLSERAGIGIIRESK